MISQVQVNNKLETMFYVAGPLRWSVVPPDKGPIMHKSFPYQNVFMVKRKPTSKNNRVVALITSLEQFVV